MIKIFNGSVRDVECQFRIWENEIQKQSQSFQITSVTQSSYVFEDDTVCIHNLVLTVIYFVVSPLSLKK